MSTPTMTRPQQLAAVRIGKGAHVHAGSLARADQPGDPARYVAMCPAGKGHRGPGGTWSVTTGEPVAERVTCGNCRRHHADAVARVNAALPAAPGAALTPDAVAHVRTLRAMADQWDRCAVTATSSGDRSRPAPVVYHEYAAACRAKADAITAGTTAPEHPATTGGAVATVEALAFRPDVLARVGTGTRSEVGTTEPTREGNGWSRHWRRVVRGRLYAFTAVTMPDGERRYFARVYNGYAGGISFACAWTPVLSLTVCPDAAEVEPAPAPAPGTVDAAGAVSLVGEVYPWQAVRAGAGQDEGGVGEWPVFAVYGGAYVGELWRNLAGEWRAYRRGYGGPVGGYESAGEALASVGWVDTVRADALTRPDGPGTALVLADGSSVVVDAATVGDVPRLDGRPGWLRLVTLTVRGHAPGARLDLQAPRVDDAGRVRARAVVRLGDDQAAAYTLTYPPDAAVMLLPPCEVCGTCAGEPCTVCATGPVDAFPID